MDDRPAEAAVGMAFKKSSGAALVSGATTAAAAASARSGLGSAPVQKNGGKGYQHGQDEDE